MYTSGPPRDVGLERLLACVRTRHVVHSPVSFLQRTVGVFGIQASPRPLRSLAVRSGRTRNDVWHRFIAVDIPRNILDPLEQPLRLPIADLFAVMSADDDSTLSDTIIDKLAPTTADSIPLVWSSDNDAQTCRARGHPLRGYFEVGKFYKHKGYFQPFFTGRFYSTCTVHCAA